MHAIICSQASIIYRISISPMICKKRENSKLSSQGSTAKWFKYSQLIFCIDQQIFSIILHDITTLALFLCQVYPLKENKMIRFIDVCPWINYISFMLNTQTNMK